MDKIVNIQSVDPDTLQLQNYKIEDESLISNSVEEITFDPSQDYLEYFILDLNSNILSSNLMYPGYKIQDNIIAIDPQKDLESQGFNEGQYYTLYNFLRRKLSSSPSSTLYIQDISSDRTELRLNTTQISNVDIVDLTTQLATDIANASGTYQDFYLDFGDNKLIIATNIALDNSNPLDPTVLIKLYEPLPSNFTFQNKCWVVEQIAESKSYRIELTTVFDFSTQLNYLNSPNFNLDIKDKINSSTVYQNYNNMSQNTSVLGSGSLIYQINSLLVEKGVEINIDYTDYSEFVHFSSAQTRLENFYYKLALIEQYSYSSSITNNTSSYYSSGSQIIYNNKINEIITNFDGYEYFLYFNSESYAWPKTNSTPPYVNYSTTDIIATTWLTDQTVSASLYDEENADALINAIPSYLKNDSQNAKYELFVQMIGQHFDNVWVYLKDITNKFDADNRVDYGISKDMVAQAIKDLGINIYQNNFSEADIYTALIGLTPSGSTLLLPFATGSLPAPTGFEYIDTFVTSSNSILPLDDVNKEIYKRIYHNLPILLKKKGTPEGLRLLINLYGIPDTILRINEFGGKSNEDNWDNFQDQFNYAFHSDGSGYVKTLYTLNTSSAIVVDPATIEFRFKTNGVPTSSIYNEVLMYSSTFAVTLDYSGSNSGSYSGSISSSYNNYGTLKYISSYGTSQSIYLPFFDEGWWSVMLTNNFITGSTNINSGSMYAKNSIYTGYDGQSIGFQSSSSLYETASLPSGDLFLSYTSSVNISGTTYYPFSGSFQELRMYDTILSENKFDDYVMNPYSIEGNNLTGYDSSLINLLFRAPLGTMLDNDTASFTRTSIHPQISTYPATESFMVGNSTYTLSGSYSFEPNIEVNYQSQTGVGIKNAITNRIRVVDNIYPTGSTLSQYKSIQQYSFISESFNATNNYVEVAFSPQDEVNDDIISQLGFFNIGDYIGDPRQISSSLSYYPDLNTLRDIYFSKYTQNYNLWDYIRIIKFYDNSLFKMIKDFTPARTSLATGIVIKQTFLERNKYPLPQVNTDTTVAFIGSPTSRTLNIEN